MEVKLTVTLDKGTQTLLKGILDKIEAKETITADPRVNPYAEQNKAMDVDTEADEDDEIAPPKKALKKAAAKKAAAPTLEDDEDLEDVKDEATDFDDIEDDEEIAAPKKATKAKALTLDDVNDACKARAKGGRRAEVVAILKKKFKTETVSGLKPEQYAQAIAALQG